MLVDRAWLENFIHVYYLIFFLTEILKKEKKKKKLGMIVKMLLFMIPSISEVKTGPWLFA